MKWIYAKLKVVEYYAKKAKTKDDTELEFKERFLTLMNDMRDYFEPDKK